MYNFAIHHLAQVGRGTVVSRFCIPHNVQTALAFDRSPQYIGNPNRATLVVPRSLFILLQLAFVPEKIVCHVHCLLVRNFKGAVQDGLVEVSSYVVVADAFRNRVVPFQTKIDRKRGLTHA